jgi:hypothetical protein
MLGSIPVQALVILLGRKPLQIIPGSVRPGKHMRRRKIAEKTSLRPGTTSLVLQPTLTFLKGNA